LILFIRIEEEMMDEKMTKFVCGIRQRRRHLKGKAKTS
jgi:hypothetical protein